MNNKRKEGFTLVELLAVIAIIAILVVMALPAVLKMVNQAKRALFRQTAYSYIGAAKDKCMSENIKGESDTFTYMSEDGVIDTGKEFKKYITGTEPDKVQLSTTPKCSSTIAIYDKNMKLCAFKDYDMEEVLLADVSDSSKCEIGKEIKDDSAPIFTGYSCSNPGDIKITEEKYFTFDQTTGTITGYSDEGPKDIIIPCQIGGKDVTTIGQNAFKSKSLTSVIMPDTITSIGYSAFNGNQIAKLELGNSVETIERGAFANNQLTTLTIPNSVKKIADKSSYSCGLWTCYVGTFENNKLTEVIFGSGIEYIGTNAFTGSSSGNQITNVDFNRSENLKTISAEAFNGNKILSLDITNSNTLTTIGSNSFKGNQLTSLKLKGTDLTIGSGAFQNNLIEELELKGTVTSVVADALKNNQMPDEGAYIYGSYSDNKPTNTTLTSYAGANRNNITIPDEITTVTATFSDLGISGTFDSGDGLTSIKDRMFTSNALTKVIIGKSVTSIGSRAFTSNRITEVIIGDNVKTIGYISFARNKISKLKLGDNVETINSGAFAYNELTSLTLPDSVTTIKDEDYEKEGWSTIYYGTFKNNKLTEVTFGSGIEYIGTNAFAGSSSGNQITKVNFSKAKNLKTIASGAFKENKLTDLNMDNLINLATINSNAFYNNQITDLEIPSSVTTIGASAFASNTNLSRIFIYGKVDSSNFTSLGSSWNGTCTNIIYELDSCYGFSGNTITSYAKSCSKKIEIPTELGGNKITSIGDNAFKDAGLTNVIIPESITSIGANAFSGNTIDPIIVKGKASSKDFTSLGTNWNNSNHVIYEKDLRTCLKGTSTTVTGFYSNSVCTSAIIPNTVTTIEANAFKEILLDKITVEDGTRLTNLGNNWNGTVYKIDFEGDSYDYNCFTLDGSKVTKYKNYCKANVDLSTSIQGITITEIGDNAFNNTAITSAILGSKITKIGVNSFSNNNLSSVTLNNGLIEIGDKAFYNAGLTTVVIPRTVTTIGNNVFDNNTGLESITINGKSNSSEFDKLGTNWNGTCTNIIYSK